MTRTRPESLNAAVGQRRRSTVPSKRALVTHANSTVLGSRWKERDWKDALNFSRAVLRRQSTLMVALVGPERAPKDVHLDVPLTDDPECVYRVRPRSKRVTGAVQDDAGAWWWVEEAR